MKRLGLYILLGPLLSWLTFLAMLTPKLLTSPRFENGLAFFAYALVACSMVGFPFFLALAGIDRVLSRFRWRVVAGALLGFATAFALTYGFSRGVAEKDFETSWFWFGLMGAVPGAVCSYLSGRATVDA